MCARSLFLKSRSFWAAAVLIGAIGVPTVRADSDDDDRKANLSRIVVVGDSLSAGFQNFSLFDSDSAPGLPPGGQKHGYAALVAQQAQADLKLPLISFPGIPQALVLNAGQITRFPGLPGLRENPAQQTYNLSVPGFTVADVLARPFPGNPAGNAIDAMSDSILALPGNAVPGCGPLPVSTTQLIVSEITCAVALKPTTVLVSIGNNDALQGLTQGLPPTPPLVFAAQYAVMLAKLASTRASIVVSNIPDVTSIPFLIPVPAFVATCGVARLPFGATAADFIVPDLSSATFDVCFAPSLRKAAFIAQLHAAVASYNQIINFEAKLFHAVVVDVNGVFSNIALHGYRVGSKTLTAAYLGGIFSLDAIHPTNTGYAILANETIKTMNQRLDTEIPLVSVPQVASTDPLVF